MSVINRYIFKSLIWAFGFALMALVGMFWLAQSVALIDQIVLRGESAITFLMLSIQLLPKILYNTIPVASLIATLYLFNQMGTFGELAVLDASGRNPLRVLIPIAIMGVLLSFVLYSISLYFAPRANYALRLDLKTIEREFSNNAILAGRFVFPVEGVTIFAEESVLSGEMLNIFIEDRREEDVVRYYLAEKGVLSTENGEQKIALIAGNFHETNLQSGAASVASFDRSEFSLSREDQDFIVHENIFEMPFQKLVEIAISDQKWRKTALAELVTRFSYPLLGFSIPIMAASLFLMAPYSRRGYGASLFWASILGLASTGIAMSVRSIVEENQNAIWMAFVPSLFALCALILLARQRL